MARKSGKAGARAPSGKRGSGGATGARAGPTRSQAHHQARNRAAQRAGFRNYYQYRKATADPKVARLLRKTGIERGRDRYELAALASNVAQLPGKPGSKRRDKKAGILSDAIRRAGKNPTGFWAGLGSPKKRRR